MSERGGAHPRPHLQMKPRPGQWGMIIPPDLSWGFPQDRGLAALIQGGLGQTGMVGHPADRLTAASGDPLSHGAQLLLLRGRT